MPSCVARRLLSIAVLVAFVNAPALAQDPAIAKRLARLLGEATREWGLAKMDAARAKLIGLETGSPIRKLSLKSSENADGVSRLCEVVMDAAEKKKVCLLISAGTMVDPQNAESYVFRLTPAGDLEKVFKVKMAFKDGKVVRGGGTSEVVSADEPSVKEMLQKELDFWLKGRYKKNLKAAVVSPTSASR